MTDRFFEVKLVISKTVKVRVPRGLKGYGTAREAAKEFAVSSKRFSPEYVISEDEDYVVKSVRELKKAEAA